MKSLLASMLFEPCGILRSFPRKREPRDCLLERFAFWRWVPACAGTNGWGVLAAVLIVATSTTVRADAVEAFYRGKSLRMLIGYGPGGGYDLYGRLVAEFLPRHIPGHPSIVPQNMPGAGSFAAAYYMADGAPKDGTVLGVLAQTLALDTVTKRDTRLDIQRFHYLGRAVTNIDTGVALPKSGITSFADVRNREYTVGASGGGSTTVMFPSALIAHAGAKFKLVRGYKGTADIILALERGEVDIVGAYGLPGMLASHPGWVNNAEAVILWQCSLTRHRLLANVPTLPELATDEEGRGVLRAVASTGDIGRSILTTPDVPAERLATLRKAFADMVRDPDFIAAAAQRKLMLDPATGEEMDAIVSETLRLPASVIAKVGEMMK
jgi:tripartite-type tricarboxylate transporter receptor subunit TctC